MSDEVQTEPAKRKGISNGTPLGNATEAFHAAKGREAKHQVLKDNPELRKYFRIDDFAPAE